MIPDVATTPDDGPATSTTTAVSFGDLFVQRWTATVRLALLLVDDRPTAEDVAQEAFTGLLRQWHHLHDPDRVHAYLHRAVVNGARSVLRRRRTARAWSPLHAGAGDGHGGPGCLVGCRRHHLPPRRDGHVPLRAHLPHLADPTTVTGALRELRVSPDSRWGRSSRPALCNSTSGQRVEEVRTL